MCRPTPQTDNANSNVASSLKTLKKQLASPRDIAIARMYHLGIMSAGGIGSSFSSSQPTSTETDQEEAGGGGLPMMLVSLLEQAAEVWTIFYQSMITKNNYDSSSSHNNMAICNSSEVQLLQQTISFLSNVSTLDPTLGEEFSRAGSQPICNRIIDQINKCTAMLGESLSIEDSDALIDLQDVVFEIYSPSFGKRNMAYSNEELGKRLPLVYNLTPVLSSTPPQHENEHKECNITTVFINQVTKRQSAQADVGYVMWPSAIILSRWLLSNPTVIQNKSVLELGAGCALVGITAARILLSQNNGSDDIEKTQHQQEEEGEEEGQAEARQEVIITDVNELVLENISQNIKLNDATSIASVAKLDFYTQTGTHHTPGKWIAGEVLNGAHEIQRKPVDVILAADIICQPEDAIAASKTIFDALKPNGGLAYIVCANAEHRFGVEIFAEECIKRGLIVETANVAEMYDGQLMKQDMESATGYVDGMELSFFKIVKQ